MPTTSLRIWQRLSMRSKRWAAAALMAAAIMTGPIAPRAHAETAAAADTVYRHGYVYTIDARDSVQTALAIRAGRIVYVGSDAGLAPFMSPKTAVVDLHGRM